MSRITTLDALKTLSESSLSEATSKPVRVLVGMATCGIASGARETLEAMQKAVDELGLDNVVVQQTGCVGSCYAEPTVEVLVDGQDPIMYGYVDAEKGANIVACHLKAGQVVEDLQIAHPSRDAKQVRIALRNCGLLDPEKIEDAIAHSAYMALADLLANKTPADAIATMKASGLRGRGGAGFPTGMKWEFASKYDADQKYVVCNADEGDPGAFMDRSILEGDPHSVLEAMAIAGYAIGATKGYIYIRAEYPLAIERLNIAIGQAMDKGLLGKDILGSGFDFEIELRYGAGAFVCGEETALLNSIEGKRGEPNNKPPFPAEKGLWQKPTIVNNVETLANVPAIFLKGADWFSSIGEEGNAGTKVFALAGKVQNVGLVEVPMGTTLREVIYDIGGGIQNGKSFKSVQTGGPSGGCIPAALMDTKIGYENLQKIGSIMGSGGMIVMDEDNCMVNIAKFYLEFTMDESCGKCTACRVGNKRLFEILTKITEGKGTMESIDELRDLANVIKDTALCGLGQTSPNPVLSTITHFMDEYVAHVVDKKCPAGVCKSLVSYSILEDRCIGCTACARACPVKCISGSVKEAHVIDQDECIKCGQCMAACRFDAVVKA